MGQRRIKVMPDFYCTGVWRLDGGIMFEYEELGLPGAIVRRMRQWLRDYDDCWLPQAYGKRVSKKKAERIYHEGKRIAEKIKAFKPHWHVEYWCETKDNTLTKIEISNDQENTHQAKKRNRILA